MANYSPFRGLKGTICAVNLIDIDQDEPFCFYLIALEGVQLKEPIWFEYTEVELITPRRWCDDHTRISGNQTTDQECRKNEHRI